jgi:hypothetical protein
MPEQLWENEEAVEVTAEQLFRSWSPAIGAHDVRYEYWAYDFRRAARDLLKAACDAAQPDQIFPGRL